MSKLDEKLLNRIKDEVAKENGDKEWTFQNPDLWPEVCRRYAEEVNKPDINISYEGRQ